MCLDFVLPRLELFEACESCDLVPPTLEVSCPPPDLPPFVILLTSFSFFMEANAKKNEEKAAQKEKPAVR